MVFRAPTCNRQKASFSSCFYKYRQNNGVRFPFARGGPALLQGFAGGGSEGGIVKVVSIECDVDGTGER